MVAAITNLLFYDVPANLLFHEDSERTPADSGVVGGLGKTAPLRFSIQVATDSNSKLATFLLAIGDPQAFSIFQPAMFSTVSIDHTMMVHLSQISHKKDGGFLSGEKWLTTWSLKPLSL